jgi:hypothetical protein
MKFHRMNGLEHVMIVCLHAIISVAAKPRNVAQNSTQTEMHT